MHQRLPTDYPRRDDRHFTGLDARIVFGARMDGRAAHIYTCPDSVREWDGIAGGTHAIGNFHGTYGHCSIKITGKEERYNQRNDGALRCRVTIGLGSDHPEDIETFTAWLMGDLSSFGF